MTEDAIRAQLSGTQTLALTLWGEARGEPVEGRIAIAAVVWNRAVKTSVQPPGEAQVKAVCLAPEQFSCWNPGPDPNHQRVLAVAQTMIAGQPLDPILRECLFIAQGTVGGSLRDNTGGATNYLTTQLYESDRAPSWAQAMKVSVVIGEHTFLRNT